MKKTAPIFLAFLCMGFGDAVATFVGKAKDAFELTNFQAQLVSFMGFIMFGLLSVPMGILQEKISKKYTLLIGLFFAFVGVLVVLIAGLSSYSAFLCSVLLLGAGAAILQVAGNPIMRDVSTEGTYSSNLSLGQFIKAIGSNTAPVIFFLFALFATRASGQDTDKNFEWNVVFAIFAVGIVITMISVALLKIKETKSDGVVSIGSCLALMKNPYVLSMVVGIFVYVGAENCVSNGMPIYFSEKFGVSSSLATQYVSYFFLAIMTARLIGAFILRRISPKLFLSISAMLSLLGFAMMLPEQKILTTIALFVIAVGYANIFPLIFSMAIDKIPEKSNELSGLMVTAIVGAAFLPLLMGAVADKLGILIGFVVPAIATAYILILSLRKTN